MATTDEQLQEKRERNAKLDQQLRAEKAQVERAEKESYNDAIAAELDAEADRMQAALDAVRAANGTTAAAAPAPAPTTPAAPAAAPAATPAPSAKEGK